MAQAIVVTTGEVVTEGRSAVPVIVDNTLPAVGPARNVIVAPDHAPRAGGPPLTVADVTGQGIPGVGPALPVYVVSGSLGTATSGGLPGRALTFFDEFTGASLDLAKWAPVPPLDENGGHSYEPSEKQANIASAITVGSGVMSILAQKVNPPGPQVDGLDYTSGCPSTFGTFSQAYGRWEIRCKLYTAAGRWPACFLLLKHPNLPPDYADAPEIDIVEMKAMMFAVHIGWRDYGNLWDHTTLDLSGLDASAFHTYACEWTLDAIEFYVDDVLRYTATTNIGSQPLFLNIQNSLGGAGGGNIDDGLLPHTLPIEYVRVYAPLGPFDPNFLSPQYRYVADTTALANGAAVDSISDRSGNLIVLAQPIGSMQPTYQTNALNGHAILSFDGVDDWLHTSAVVSSGIGTGDFTFYVVVRSSDVTSANYQALLGNVDSPGCYIRNTHPQLYWGTDKIFSTVLASNTWYLIWFERKSGVISCYVNGVKDATTFAVATSWPLHTLTLGCESGLAPPNNSALNGSIAECAFYYKSLTDGERGQIETYVHATYAIF